MMMTDPATENLARVAIYELAITLRFLLVERECEGPPVGLWPGTVEEATHKLAGLVKKWPGAAQETAEFIQDCPSPGPVYAQVISTMWSMLARERGNAILEEMRGTGGIT